MTEQYGVWRAPGEESIDLYPGLVVCDNRHSGSITIGRSRLPVNAITSTVILDGWDSAEFGWELSDVYDYSDRELSDFLWHLLEVRGEFARLLLVLADAERCERWYGGWVSWWETKRHRKRVGDQLRRCLERLDGPVHREAGS